MLDLLLTRPFKNASKIVFLDAGLTWLLRECGPRSGEVMAAESVAEPAAELQPVRERWAAAQRADRKTLEARHGDALAELPDGLLMLASPGEPALVLVPATEREALMARVHSTTQHAGHRRMLSVMKQSYAWEGMSADALRLSEDVLSAPPPRPSVS